MIRRTLMAVLLTVAVGGAVAACNSTPATSTPGAPTTAPTVAPSEAPSTSVEPSVAPSTSP